MRGQRQRVRPDLVRGVAVCRDAVSAGDHQIDEPSSDQRRRRAVGYDLVCDAVLSQFPRRQPRALQPRTSLADVYVNAQARFGRLVDWRKRGAPILRRQPAGVAMRRYPRAVFDQLAAELANPLGCRHLRLVVGAGGFERGVRRAVVRCDRVEPCLQVHGSRPRGVQQPVGGFKVLAEQRRQRQAVGGHYADRRRPAHTHAGNRVSDLLRRPGGCRLEPVRQQALVYVADRAVCPPDCPVLRPVNLHSEHPYGSSATSP